MKCPISDQFAGFWRLRNLDIHKGKQWSVPGTAQGPPFNQISLKFMKIINFSNSECKMAENGWKSAFLWFLWFPVGSHPAWTYEFACNYNGLGSFCVSWRWGECVFHFAWENHENIKECGNSENHVISWKSMNFIKIMEINYFCGSGGSKTLTFRRNYLCFLQCHEFHGISSFRWKIENLTNFPFLQFPLKCIKTSLFCKKVPNGAQGT